MPFVGLGITSTLPKILFFSSNPVQTVTTAPVTKEVEQLGVEPKPITVYGVVVLAVNVTVDNVLPPGDHKYELAPLAVTVTTELGQTVTTGDAANVPKVPTLNTLGTRGLVQPGDTTVQS